MKKSPSLFLLLAAVTLASSSVFAQTIVPLQYYNQEVAAQNATNNLGVEVAEFTPTAGIYANAEWLSWNHESSNRTYAVTSDPVWLTERENKDANVKGNGIRANLGVRGANMWDAGVGFTYFNGADSGSIDSSVDPSSVLKATRSRLDLEAQSAAFDDETEIMILDFEVGRHLTTNAFDFRPFGGFRWVEIDETQNSAYTYLDPSRTERVNAIGATSDFQGYGLRMGAEAKVAILGCLRAFGRGSASLLAGSVKSKALEVDEQQGVVLNRNFSESVATPGLDVAAGLALDLGNFEVKGGYELNTWFNASNIGGQRSDVTTHGFFAGASWNY